MSDEIEEVEEIEEVVVEEEEKKPQFDKVLQQEQQRRANAERNLINVNQKVNELEAKLIASHVSPPAPDSDDDPYELLKKLQVKVDKLEQTNESLIGESQSSKIKEAYTRNFDKCDRKYGASHRNEALVFAKAKAIEEGYTCIGSDFPPDRDTMLYIEMGYADSSRSAPPTKTATKRTKADVGKTGSAPAKKAGFKGSHEEVMADMKAKGGFANYYSDD